MMLLWLIKEYLHGETTNKIFQMFNKLCSLNIQSTAPSMYAGKSSNDHSKSEYLGGQKIAKIVTVLPISIYFISKVDKRYVLYIDK